MISTNNYHLTHKNFLHPARYVEETQKIDKFMELLERSEVGKIIESVKSNSENCKGRKGYNKYNLLATVIYCFSKFNASLRDIEDKCIFDFRVWYIMEGEVPDHSVIGDFINTLQENNKLKSY